MESVDQTLSKIIIMGRSQLNIRKSLTAMKEKNSSNNAPKSKTTSHNRTQCPIFTNFSHFCPLISCQTSRGLRIARVQREMKRAEVIECQKSFRLNQRQENHSCARKKHPPENLSRRNKSNASKRSLMIFCKFSLVTLEPAFMEHGWF